MYNKFLFYMSICFFLSNYSSEQPNDLSELQKAEYHKKRLGMPTPASFGQLQIESPLEYMKSTYLDEWLNNSLRLENQLSRLSEHREWMLLTENNLRQNLLLQEESERSSIYVQRAVENRSGAVQSFNVANRQVIGQG